MFLFISTGTYFKLLDLEISGDLEILEMSRDDICIYMFMYIYVCVYVYIYGYNSFYSQRVSLAPLHPEMFTNIYIWGQAIFSHKIIFWIREESLSLGFSFDIKCLLLKAKFVHRNTLSIWQPLDSSCAESSSLWKFCDVSFPWKCDDTHSEFCTKCHFELRSSSEKSCTWVLFFSFVNCWSVLKWETWIVVLEVGSYWFSEGCFFKWAG